ncbi:MAG: hypothetical protein R3C31_13020 [Hyphomonadaceae bacterium]
MVLYRLVMTTWARTQSSHFAAARLDIVEHEQERPAELLGEAVLPDIPPAAPPQRRDRSWRADPC